MLLEVVKQEMARVNINILGISELKWTKMGEFNLHLASIRQMSGQVSRGSTGEYKADEQAGVAGLSCRVSRR